jgi:phospholipid/cholesterol/gamma-HCH transport system permease protein
MNAEFIFDQENNLYLCKGAWSVSSIDDLPQQLTSLPKSAAIAISGSSLTVFDSAGALLLTQYINALKTAGNTVTLENLTKQQEDMLELVDSNQEFMNFEAPERPVQGLLYKVGKETIEKMSQFDGLVILIGDISTKLFMALGQWQRFQGASIVSIINTAGLQALPIIGLLSFLIGVVLAYQMGLQLETYGANNFIAYLSGMAIFREFAPLITAIIVAGRTSSAFTAQIGSMKINEEVDAILTMGLSPTELLVLPKVIGLILVFPLLIFWANVFGILGALVMSQIKLGINPPDFLTNLKDSVGLKQMLLGLYKAPVFALLIALVGCFQGFRVQASADSVGSQTTKSVVQALFLIIIADAAFSILYSWMGV